MPGSHDAVASRAVGVRDIPRVWLAPRRLFARVEDVAVWGWPLLILLCLVTLIGYATVETGLIDREIDRQVNERIARLDMERRDVVERSELRELYEQERKAGEFQKLLTRIRVIGAEPARTLATALLTAAALYGVVALSGRKPEWHTLLTICIFAGFVDVLRMLLQLVLMLSFRTLDVDTSLAPVVQLIAGGEGVAAEKVVNMAALTGLLSAVDPFRIWYWGVVIVGLSATRQLRGWRAWGPCLLCWLAGAGARAGLAAAASAAGGAAQG